MRKGLYCNTNDIIVKGVVFELSDSKNRSVGRSFRINQQYLDILNEEAEREGISLNSLVNRVLKDYSEYQRFFTRYGIAGLTHKNLAVILEATPKDALREIARNTGLAILLDEFRIMGLTYTYDCATYFMSTILAQHEHWFKYEQYTMNDKEIFHLRHDLGENWSLYVAEVLSTLIERCCNKRVKKEFSAGAITLEISNSEWPKQQTG
jgi:hypothetical protein